MGWGHGGGISNNGTLTIINSTLSNNYAADSGGGLCGGGTITNSTMSDNTATNEGGGILTTGVLTIGNTILKAGTSGANISGNPGTVTSQGYNLSSDDGGGFLNATGDQINTDPLLGPLQFNGGSTFTHHLLAGSPAINAGDPNFTPPPFYDQRGADYDRVFNGGLDIGSLEVQPAPTPSPPPTPAPTPCGLLTFLSENFDSTTPPALPPGWVSDFTPGPADCTPAGTCALGTDWATTPTVPDTPPHSMFHDAPGCVTDSTLDTPFFEGGATNGTFLHFRHSYDLEDGRDGAVLEISINGGPFIDFVAAGGGNLGYNGTISTDFLTVQSRADRRGPVTPEAMSPPLPKCLFRGTLAPSVSAFAWLLTAAGRGRAGGLTVSKSATTSAASPRRQHRRLHRRHQRPQPLLPQRRRLQHRRPLLRLRRPQLRR